MVRCKTCRYFHQTYSVGDEHWTQGLRITRAESGGLCRRHAPTACMNPEIANAGHGIWPEVKASDWCGEHQPTAEG